ncbi:LysR family transcriptional regulator [uncultured Phascolarctobacterium sp.]|uniref:LysR family transcriptional regulator n=1 Tax=uncultured Phascolarctobacterium sp. TaxID=512296 RepID=UPI0026284B16|nr:LysR family transcriptional regulator [uncultured Phascolarctobacterium sp.]
MDIEYYRNFIAIVDTGSISAAAKLVNIAQPALSHQLKVLQNYYGAKLLDVKRGGHSIEMTDAGCILYNKAKYICSTERTAKKEIADCNVGFNGTLRVSLSPSMSIAFIKSTLSDFCRQYPQINYELYEVPIDEQTDQLLSGKTEIGISNAPLKQPFRFETVISRRERLVALFHKDSVFLDNDRNGILLEELEDIPVCLSRGCSELFLSVCSDSRVFPQVLSVNTTKLSTICWAEQNLGVAIVPSATEENFDKNLVCKEIKDERLFLEKSLLIVKDRQLSTVAKTFLSYYMQKI